MPNGAVLQDEWHLLIVNEPSAALSDCARLAQFTRDDVQDTVDKLTAFGCTIVLCKFNIFVDGYLNRNIRESENFRNCHFQDDLVGKGKTVDFPVSRIVCDQVGVRF